MTDTPRLGLYETAHGPELTIARGPVDGPQLLLVQPLFEEAGFTRGVAADLTRALAGHGIGSWLFDLPAQGDSTVPLEAVRLADWIAAMAAAIAHVAGETGVEPHVATVRGGAMLVRRARSFWRLAACDGVALLRPLRRAAMLGESAGLGGWPMSPALVRDLEEASLPAPAGPLRDVAWPAGAPPWRRAEPARDEDAAVALAADLAGWIAACGGR